MVHFSLFHLLRLPRRSYFWLICFVSGADQSLKHPEGQCVPVSCRLVIPGDALHTSTAGYVFGGMKEGCKSCLRVVSCLPVRAGQLLSVLMLQWVGHEEIKNLLIYAGSISSKDTWMYLRGGHREIIVLLISIAPLKKTQTELTVALDGRQRVVPSQWNLQPTKKLPAYLGAGSAWGWG